MHIAVTSTSPPLTVMPVTRIGTRDSMPDKIAVFSSSVEPSANETIFTISLLTTCMLPAVSTASPFREIIMPAAVCESSASFPSLNRIPSTRMLPSAPSNAFVRTRTRNLNKSSFVGAPVEVKGVASFRAKEADAKLASRSMVPKKTSLPLTLAE